MTEHNKDDAPVEQKDVDKLASFVEACGELQLEPFFGKDERLSFRSVGNRWAFSFGDRFHFRSALISFRRLWMPTEPSHWRTVVEILQRLGWPPFVTGFAQHHSDTIDQVARKDSHLLGLSLPGGRVVDLWLNTVFAHGGLEGKNKRGDFESIIDRHGHAVFEFCFRSLVKEVGSEFINISNLAARPALEYCKEDLGVSPSFRIGAAFGSARKEKTKEGHIVIREGSSEFFSEESAEERFARILARNDHKEVGFVFEHLGMSRTELLRAALRHTSFRELLKQFGGRVEIKGFKLGPFHPGRGFRASWTINSSRVDVLEDYVVASDQPGIDALDSALARFRKQLLEED